MEAILKSIMHLSGMHKECSSIRLNINHEYCRHRYEYKQVHIEILRYWDIQIYWDGGIRISYYVKVETTDKIISQIY